MYRVSIEKKKRHINTSGSLGKREILWERDNGGFQIKSPNTATLQ